MRRGTVTDFVVRAVCSGIVLVAAATAAADGLNMTPSKNPIGVGDELTITFGPPVLSPGDEVTFDFGDSRQETVAYNSYCGLFGGCTTVTHIYTRTGTFTVVGTGMISGFPVSGTLEITVSAGNDMFVLATAHAQGQNQTVWRSDVEIHNYGTGKARFEIALLPRDTDNSNPLAIPYELNPGALLRLSDVLMNEFGFTGAAALRISPENSFLMVTSRTYNLGETGTYGQYIPALTLGQAITTTTIARLIQLSHNPGLQSGFRTNLGLLNASPFSIDVELTFLDAIGVLLGTHSLTLEPYEFKQLDKAFELVTSNVVDDGYVKVRTITSQGLFFAYASVVDNLTGDPTLIPAFKP